MKLLLINSSFGGGGITTYATQLIACLSADTEMTVVLGNDRIAPITDPRVNVIYHDTMSLTIKNALYFIDLINNDIKPDVVIVSTAFVIPVIVPYLNDNIKVFTVSHSGMFFHSDYCAVNHQYLDGIIAASSDYNKHYLEKKFKIKDKKKIRVIYNFVKDDEELENLRLQKHNQEPIKIVYSGSSSGDKSPDLVAQVVSKLLKTNLNFQFLWLGNSTIPLTKTIFKRTKIKTVHQLMPADERLIFPGYFPDKREFDRFMGSANIMFAPSRNEGCSMALLEGHRAGCIFIVGDYENSNNEIVSKGNSGFVINHCDTDAFVDKIRDIILNPSFYDQYYENSHEAFKTMLSYPVWREKIFDVVNSLANHKVRKKSVSKKCIYIGICRMMLLKEMNLIKHFFKMSLPSYITFRRLYAKSVSP